MIQITELSKRYAGALFELATQAKNVKETQGQFRGFVKMVNENSDVMAFMSSAVVQESEKIALFEKATGDRLLPSVSNFIKTTLLKNRFFHLPEMAEAFDSMVDEQNGVVRGQVRSAVALDAEQRTSVEQTASRVTGRKVIFDYTVDAGMVAGLKAQVAGWMFDDSVDSHLRAIKESLVK
jgi:F-type H+-transporting ATPase subunit delta